MPYGVQDHGQIQTMEEDFITSEDTYDEYDDDEDEFDDSIFYGSEDEIML